MKNPYGNLFIQSQSRNDVLTRGKSVSSNQKSAFKTNQSVRNAFTLLLAPLQFSFIEVCRVSSSLLQFSRKLAINHRRSRKVRTGLSLWINRLKSTSRNSRTKALEQKPDETLRLACLVNSSNRRKR